MKAAIAFRLNASSIHLLLGKNEWTNSKPVGGSPNVGAVRRTQPDIRHRLLSWHLWIEGDVWKCLFSFKPSIKSKRCVMRQNVGSHPVTVRTRP